MSSPATVSGTADVVVPQLASTGSNSKNAVASPVGSLPVRIRAAAEKNGAAAPGTRLTVTVADQQAAQAAGIDGLLISLTPASGGGGALGLDVDTSAIAARRGGDFISRLRLVSLPACVLTTPQDAACRVQTPVPGVDNRVTEHALRATVTLPAAVQPAKTTAQPTNIDQASRTATATTTQAMVLAATAAPSGSTGSFSSTSLAPSSQWSGGSDSGDFTWSYGIDMPQPFAGAAPDVTLSYDSGSVDGRTDTTNNQTSPIGEGFELAAGGFIERSYKSCSEYTDLPTASQTGDECWAGQVLNLSLGGKSSALVWDPTTNQVHPADDNGERVDLLTNASNGVYNGEYWKITTPDGTQYFFGRNHGPGYTNQANTNSAWTVPVYGAHSGDPCYNATFASASCLQAWRWNLDYVEDVHGNVAMYYYSPETNYYTPNNGANSAKPVQYTRGGVLEHIEYGLRDDNGTVYANPAVDKVVFAPAERCIPNENNNGFSCDPAQFTAANAVHWHDVPFDQNCAQGATCSVYSPTFWSRKRITAITTQVYSGGVYQNVDSYSLTQAYPDTGDATPFALALASVKRCGSDGTTCTPPVTFLGSMKANRVPVAGQDSTYLPAINKWRVSEIDTETGEQIQVFYNTPACSPSNLPSSDSTNTLDCFPEYWSPLGATKPIESYFYHYTVRQVIESDPTGGAPNKTTNYAYLGGAAWHFDDSELAKAAQRTYSQFRGYAHVQTRTGSAPDPITLSDSLFLRGMDGDILPSGKRSVTVSDAENDDTVTDANALAGRVFETLTYTADGGTVDHGTVTDYTVTGPTATRTRTGLNPLQALMVLTTRERTRQALVQPANGWRRTVTNTAYNSLGMPTQVDDQGDGSQPKCTRTTYLTNTPTWLTVPSRTTVTGEVCPSGSQAGKLISDTETSYDGQAYGAAPTRGDATSEVQAASSSDGTAAGTITYAPASTKAYDSYGRMTSSADSMGRASSTAYTPSTLGPVTQVVDTSLASTDPLTRSTTKVVDPLRGVTTASIDVAGLRTDATYDALGRRTQVWEPGRSKSAGQSPNYVYGYTLSNTGPSVVTVQQLMDDATYSTSETLYDSLLRSRQTQADAEGGGRIVSETLYNSNGWIAKTNSSFYATGAPTPTIYAAGDSSIPQQTVTTFDGQGRAVKAAEYHYANYTWETDTVYGGDRTTTIPPSGGVATTTISDARGNKTEIDQYLGTPTVVGNVVTGTVNGSGMRYGYDFAGRQTSVTDPTGKNVWGTGYDLRGRKTSQTDPDTGTTNYTYNDDGEQLTSTDSRGQTVAYTYDNLGRKTGQYAGSTTGTRLARWTYDTLMKGKPTLSSSYGTAGAYTVATTGYTATGMPTGTRITIPSGEASQLYGSYTTSYSYTPITNKVSAIAEPAAGGLGAETVNTTFTHLGNPSTTSGQNLYVSATTYSPFGEALQYTQGPSSNPAWQTFTYDDQTRRLTEVRLDQQAAPPGVDKLDYSYNPSGQITKISDLRLATTAETQCFGYDGVNQLSEAWTATDGCAADPAHSGNATVGGAIAPYWTSWDVDPQTGNRRSQTQHALPGASGGDTVTSYTYPAAGAAQPHTVTGTSTTGPGANATSYTYDTAGETTGRCSAPAYVNGTCPATTDTTGGAIPGGTQTLSWNTAGQLTSITAGTNSTSFVYDADGHQLMRKAPGQTTLYLGDTELVLNTTTGVVAGTRYYKQGSTTVAALDSTTGHVRYLMADTQGTVDVQLDSVTNTAAFRQYTPYGGARGTAPTAWTGQRGWLGVGTTDTSTGLTNVGAREYDPSTGRFISRDPVPSEGNPSQLGGYAYSGNDPISASDPTGQWGFHIHLSLRSVVHAAVNVVNTVAAAAPVLNLVATATAAIPGVNVVTAGMAAVGDAAVVASSAIATVQGVDHVYHDVKDGKGLLQTALDVADTIASAKGVRAGGARAADGELPNAFGGKMSAAAKKSDEELQADADALHQTVRDRYTERAYNGTTVATGEIDGDLVYTVNRNKTNPDMRQMAEDRGYTRVSGRSLTKPGQTDAEQIMLNASDAGVIGKEGRMATSRIPCGEERQDCGTRVDEHPGINLVGRYAREMLE